MLNLIKSIILPARATIIVAISGGADSICLAHLLWKSQKYKIILAHFNHHLRKKESKHDEDFVKRFANTIELPLEIGHWKTPVDSETKAREARYKFLRKIQKQQQAQGIFLAHHQDDQIETVLFNFIRGAGLKGFTGMNATENDLYRPLLTTTKKEILQYCRQNKLRFCTDKSNFDTKYNRNLLRLRIIPEIKKINPNFDKILLQKIEIFRNLQDYISQGVVSFVALNKINISDFLALPQVMQTELIRVKLSQFIEPNFKIIQETLKLIEAKKTGKSKIYGNLSISIEYDKIIFSPNSKTKTTKKLLPKKINIGKITSFAGLKISTRKSRRFSKSNQKIILDYDKIQQPIFVRFWQRGDKMKPQGFSGTQKLSDIFTNQKIPCLKRSKIPILTDKNNQILAVGTLRLSQIAAPIKNTKNFLTIDY